MDLIYNFMYKVEKMVKTTEYSHFILTVATGTLLRLKAMRIRKFPII